MKHFLKICLILFFAFLLMPSFVFASEDKKTLINSIKEEVILKLDNKDSKTFISDVYNTDFAFNGVGVKWRESLPSGTKLEIFLKLEGDWVLVRESDELSKNILDQEKKVSDLIFLEDKQDNLQYKIVLKTIDKESTSSLEEIEIYYIDSTIKGSKPQIALATDNRQGLLVDNNFRIVDKNDWINSYDVLPKSTQDELWPANYKDVKKFIVHHSGVALKDSNDDGVLNNRDYEAIVRGMYNWHAKVLSWGDVGYNYIIDPAGTIYEGRSGGDGVEGGHVVRSESCNQSRFGGEDEKIGFNKGTIGITFIGDYDKEYITPKAEDALVKLIAQKALEFGISPSGMSHFQGMFLPNILGHRDVDCTTCPGKNVVSRFSLIKQKAQALYRANKDKVKYKASFVYQSASVVNVKEGQSKEVVIQFKNEGNVPWHNYSQDSGVFLGNASLKNRLAALDGFKLALEGNSQDIAEPLPDYVLAKMSQPNVYPGEVGTFKFIVDDKTPPLFKGMILALGEKGYFSGSDVSLTINNGSNFYRAQKVLNNIPPAMLVQSNGEFIIKYQNVGKKPWRKDEFFLNIYNREGGLSNFAPGNWKSEYGGFMFEEQEVVPGAEATFKIFLKAPGPGFHRQMFKLERKYLCSAEDDAFCYEEVEIGQEASDFVPGSTFDIITRVDWSYQGQLLENTLAPAMLNIWRPTVLMRFKNTGSEVWKNLRLVSYDDVGNVSNFKDSSWVDNYTVARTSKEIKPGEEISFIFRLKAPRERGVYKHNFVLKLGKKALYINGVKENEFATRVD